ncbi:MAG TPA: hypothetical protein VMP01_15960 [Pirellulaceae bacterium]|nr:hypothetical protein [Pirellulaceae bacterium]
MFAAFLCTVAALTSQVPQSSVREELGQYYETSKRPASWDASIKKIASPNADERRNAAAHLVELLEQSWQYEKSGKAPWHSTPYWGGPMENPARELRKSIVAELEEKTAAAETLPVAQWVLQHEPQVRLQDTASDLLEKIQGDQADEYRRALVLQPHSNAVVMGKLLDQLRTRKVVLPADRLKELCHHHRLAIRESARRLNEVLKGPDPGPFHPVAAFRSPAVRQIMSELQALLIELPAKDAEFVKVTVRHLQKDEVKQSVEVQGWLIKRDNDTVTIFTPYGTQPTYRDKEYTAITVAKPIKNGHQYLKLDVVTAVTVAKADIAAYVREIADIRAQGNEGFELSARGGLTGQFEGQGASLVEVILAAWLDRAGKPELAASIFLPALDTLYEDRQIVDITRHRLGSLLGRRMVVAFVGDRDYEQALKLARGLAKHYPQTQFHEYAVRLAEQLPRRMDDFKTLKLPTPAQWAEMKKNMSRREQIDFLCLRLRLLNCFQFGQPGGYNPSATQYAEPYGLSEDAAWGLGNGKTEVINPVVELVGQESAFFVDEKERSSGLNLTVADIPSLVPYLREDWYLLIVTFWRDFHPNRNLSHSRPLIAGWINGLARRDLCELERFEKMSPAELEAHLQKIIAWSEANKDKTDEDLLAESIQAEVERKSPWQGVSRRVAALVKMKSVKALAFVEHYLAEKDEEGNDTLDLLEQLQALDSKKAVASAKRVLEHKNARLRMHAAMMVLDAGDLERVIPVLAKLLESGSAYEIGDHAFAAVDKLLKLGTKEATDAAQRILRNPVLQAPVSSFDRDRFPGDDEFGRDRAAIVARLAAAGHPEGFKLYLNLLDAKGNAYGNTTYGTPVARLAADEILETMGKDNPDLQKIRETIDPEEQRLAIRQWVEAKAMGTEKK